MFCPSVGVHAAAALQLRDHGRRLVRYVPRTGRVTVRGTDHDITLTSNAQSCRESIVHLISARDVLFEMDVHRPVTGCLWRGWALELDS